MSTPRPNILLIVADCGRSDRWLGPDRRTQTPTLDRLAAGGVALPTTLVEKACTTPSFTSLLTGRYSPHHGVLNVWGDRLPDSIPLLTQTLADAGYHTYAEVTGPLLPEMGLARGFERYEYRAPCDYLHTQWGDALLQRLRSGAYRSPWFLLLHLWELHPPRQVRAGFDRPEYGTSAYEQAVSSLDAQLARVLAATGDNTLTLFTGDHGEKLAHEEYRPGTAVAYARDLLGVDQAVGLAPPALAGWAGPSVLQQFYGVAAPLLRDVRLRELRPERFSRWARLRDRLGLLLLTPWLTARDLVAAFTPSRLTAMLRRSGLLDAERSRRKVARLTRWLGRDRLLDMHLRMWINSYKHNLAEGHMLHVYDALVRVPLVLHWPGHLPAGTTTDRLVRQVDILPTIMDLLDLDPTPADGRDGHSFRTLLENRPWEPQPAFLSVSGLPRDLELRGVRTERHKYTYGPHNPELPEELYDLQADPAETRNLAASQPDLCRSLRTLADSFTTGAGISAVPVALAADDQQRIEQQLRDLGYL